MAEGSDIDREDGPHKDASVWPRLATILAGLGTFGAFVVTRWKQVEPVLNSPVTIVVLAFAIFGLGGLSVYWLVARPLEKRQARLEGVISRMRSRERLLEETVADLRVSVARMETIIDLSGIKDALTQLGTAEIKAGTDEG
jgi:type II secretory pathway component PulM